MRLTAKAHELLSACINPGDVAIDATAGNGHDTVFLAQHVGVTGRVFAFDVQQQALQATRRRLIATADNLEQRVTLVNACHSQMHSHLPAQHHGVVAAVMFNLGYLPGGDHLITTQGETTRQAVATSLKLLRPQGAICILGYTGHDGGQAEVDTVVRFIGASDHSHMAWQELTRQLHDTHSPRLFLGHRRA